MNFEDLRAIKDETEQIQKTYEVFNENTRLNRSKSARVEFLTTVRYIEKFLHPGDRILDIGAGAGEYSLYFAQKGYAVDALELSPTNVATFQSKIEPEKPHPTLVQGDARDLSRYESGFFDVVLLLGPLYHLHKETDRQHGIAEAKRVCRDSGTLFFAFINNDMIPLTEFMYDPSYFKSKDYNHETFKVEDFPFVFFTRDQCRLMLREGGVSVLLEVASDGVSELLSRRIDEMDEESYAQYLRYHFYTCEKPEMIGHTNHFLFIGKKK